MHLQKIFLELHVLKKLPNGWYCIFLFGNLAASLGFAALENIIYVLSYGTGVAITRALFAIPGHASFGIFMGYFFARAKHCVIHHHGILALFFMLLCFAFPIGIHGAYDFLLSPAAKAQSFSWYFFVLVIVIDVFALRIVHHESKTDRPL